MSSGPHPSQVKAGKISARVLKEVAQEVTPGKKVIEICTLAEKKIVEYGGRPAFPCNVSINNVAAHYTSPVGDASVLPASGLVKIDLGAQIDGYLTDVAKTFDMDGTLEGFIAATDDALEEAINMMHPGTKLGDVGKTIEKIIKAYGIKPISNLSGHNMRKWILHAGKSVPNVKTRSPETIEVGEVYAVEPYATNGAGTVIDTELVYIFANTGRDVSLEGTSEKLRLHLHKKYGPLPFATRWIGTTSSDIDLYKEIRELLKNKAIRGFPVQASRKGRPVSQSEHTVYVSEEGPVVLTRLD
ncbi:MAG: type II methionyl aminopeptidase [Candidatus Thorarchaeota archaeon]|nr:type II methionyl aminopeptidase [Candidatus Thorarchaeota archaeon]